MSQFLPSVQMVSQVYGKALLFAKPEFAERQDALYNFFCSRIMGGSNPVTQALQRIGPIRWKAPDPNPRFARQAVQSWGKVAREMGGNIMNCWDAVFYVAFQAGTMSKRECLNQSLFLHAYKTKNLEALMSHLGNPVGTPRMGDILVWHGNSIAHVALYLGTAPQSPVLNIATGSGEFIWQNSGISSWGLPGGGFTHIAPFLKVNTDTTKGFGTTLGVFRPTWWF